MGETQGSKANVWGPEDVPEYEENDYFQNDRYPTTGDSGEKWTADHSDQFQELLRDNVPTTERRDLYISKNLKRMKNLAGEAGMGTDAHGLLSTLAVFPMRKAQDGLTEWLDQNLLEMLAVYVLDVKVDVMGVTRTLWEQISVHETSLFRPGQDYMYYAMVDEVYGTNLGLISGFPYRMPQKVVDTIVIPPSVKKLEKVEHYYFTVTGRDMDAINFYKVDGVTFTPEFEMRTDGVLYQVAKGAGHLPVMVPLLVRAWLFQELCPPVKTRFLDAASYSGNEHYFRTISAQHERMLQEIGQCLPKGLRVVAPGDGSGTVITAFPNHQVSSSDRNPPLFRDQRVQRNSISLAIRGDYDVLVLSFVAAFLRKRDWEYLQLEKKKVIIVDSHPVLVNNMVTEPKYVSYFCTVYGIDGLQSTKMPELAKKDSVRFTENLLKLESFYLSSFNHGVRYLKCMQPSRQYSCPQWLTSYFREQGLIIRPERDGELFYSTSMEEHLANMHKGRSYFYKIGRVEEEVKRILWRTTIHIRPRETYIMNLNAMKCPLPAELESWHSEGYLYFWTSNEKARTYRTETFLPDTILGTDWRVGMESQPDLQVKVAWNGRVKVLSIISEQGNEFRLEVKKELDVAEKRRYEDWCKSNTPPENMNFYLQWAGVEKTIEELLPTKEHRIRAKMKKNSVS